MKKHSIKFSCSFNGEIELPYAENKNEKKILKSILNYLNDDCGRIDIGEMVLNSLKQEKIQIESIGVIEDEDDEEEEEKLLLFSEDTEDEKIDWNKVWENRKII